MNHPTRREAIQSCMLGAGAMAAGAPLLASESSPACISAVNEYSFHHDHVIGTSLDVWVIAEHESDGEVAERAVLEEIERLRLVFSTYDSSSELSWLNRSEGPVPVSPEMLQVLREYEIWQGRSGGAFNGQLGELVRVWKNAEITGVEPNSTTLARIAEQTAQRGWRIDGATVTRLTSNPLNLNSIAKGFIIDRAFAVARAKVPTLRGMLLNLGGDMSVWNPAGWLIGVQDPKNPEDNAAPLTALRLKDSSIATSGGYLRYYSIGDKRSSHLFDPRTGHSADGIASATVIAANNVTANALATTLCVLTPEEGLRLIAATPGAECLIVTEAGQQLRSAGLNAFDVPMVVEEKVTSSNSCADDAWPEDFQVKITVELPKIATPKYRKPYVAVWIENSDKKAVRTLQVWGNSQKYLKDLFTWWKFAQKDSTLVKAVARATRLPGKYDVIWDGKDDQGVAVPQGTYTVKVEVHREHGKDVLQSGDITCMAAPAKITLKKNEETAETTVDYAKKKK